MSRKLQHCNHCLHLQSWPKLCGTSLQKALPRPSISFSHGNKRSLGQILPTPPPPLPFPPCNVVRKEGLLTSHPTLHRGGGKGGASEYCSNLGKRHFVPHILARIVVMKALPTCHFHFCTTGHKMLLPLQTSHDYFLLWENKIIFKVLDLF